MKKLIRHIRQSLSMKLGLGFLLLAVPIFIVALGTLFLQSRHIIREEAQSRATTVLNTTLQRVNRYLNTIETATNSYEWMVMEDLRPEALLEYTRRITWMNHNVNGCSITMEPYFFEKYGRYFSAYSIKEGDSVRTIREGEYDYFNKVWYKTPKTLGEPCWVEPFDDYNEGTLYTTELIASYCKPMYQKGKLIGVISTDLSLRRLKETIDSEKPYPNSYFVLIGREGHYFIHPDTTKLFHQTIFSDRDVNQHTDLIALGHEMTAGKKGSMKVFIENTPCLVSYDRVPNTTWSLALVCPEDDILQSYRVLTILILLLATAGLISVVLLCRLAVSHAISPLQQLLNQSKLITAGHYDQQIAHSKSTHVVGRLQNSFAAMLAALNTHVNAIKQTNKEMLRSNEELARATQLAEEADRQKTAFIQNTTHQIRTPLNIIMGFAQVIRDSVGMLSEDEIKNIIETMDHNAKSLNRMVLMLFDSSDIGLTKELFDSQMRESVSCNEVARESIADTAEHFPQLDILFETSIPDTLHIHTNRLYLMRSLREILYNAAKYSDGKHVALKITETEHAIRFTIEDKGIGIPESYHDSMYQFFSKVNDLSEGLGLGLPLSQRHVSNLGGTLTLDTSYQVGCRFIVEIPKV